MRLLLCMFVIATLALTACRGSTEPRGCDVCTTSAIVYGHVQTTSGAPVSGARVQVEAHQNGCTGVPYGETNVRVVTLADGTYRDRPLSPAGPFMACLVVHVQPSDAAGLAAAVDSGASVQFRPDYPSGQPHDSVRVDIAIPTR